MSSTSPSFLISAMSSLVLLLGAACLQASEEGQEYWPDPELLGREIPHALWDYHHPVPDFGQIEKAFIGAPYTDNKSPYFGSMGWDAAEHVILISKNYRLSVLGSNSQETIIRSFCEHYGLGTPIDKTAMAFERSLWLVWRLPDRKYDVQATYSNKVQILQIELRLHQP